MPAIQEPFGLVEFNVNDLKDLRFDEEDSTPAAAVSSSRVHFAILLSPLMKHLRM